MRKRKPRQQLGNAFVADPLVYFLEEAEIFIQRGHELGKPGALELGRGLTITYDHSLGRAPYHHANELAIVLDVLLRLALLDSVERRLRDEHVAALDQLVHVAEKECEQQRADVRTVNVGVSHENDFGVTQLGRIKIFFTDAGAQRR